ncbi:MAG: hypothetical protein KatS3mg057_0517 [Herpetosiphonaceae bacterium]|nr:MAG: hypothetical protein KatS3mg057_0517 [Herpetosiphonaceae bacterium]
MISHSPNDHELAEALRVPEDALSAVLDEVAAELAAWSGEDDAWLQPSGPAITCTVLPSGPRSMALAFPDLEDLHRYLPDTLIPSLDVTAVSIRDLLGLLLARPNLDLVMLKPQEMSTDEEDGALLYVGLQIERARLLAAIIQRSLMEEGGLGILLASFLKWLNEEHPESDRLLVAATMARAVVEQRLISLDDLVALTGLSFDTVRTANFEASRLFSLWWTAGNIL